MLVMPSPKSGREHSSVKNGAHPFFNKTRACQRARCRVGKYAQRIAPDKQADSV
jgi:hypothetical protein